MAEENTFILQTTGFDARFPNQNQTKHWYVLALPTSLHMHATTNQLGSCLLLPWTNSWQNFVDYHKCVNARGEEFAPCNQFKKAFKSLCPNEWTERWGEQIENGTFPASLKP